MNKAICLAIVVLGGFILAQPLRSQVAGAPRPAREQLVALKASNEKLLDQQKATLVKLEETQKDAAQLRIFVRRN